MNTEEPRAPIVSESKRATYVDTPKNAVVSRRSDESRIADDASPEFKQKISGEAANWAEYIDRIYIEELMRRLDH